MYESAFDVARAEARKEARKELEKEKLVALRDTLVAMLEKKFKGLSKTARQKIERKSFDELLTIARNFPDADTLKKLGL